MRRLEWIEEQQTAWKENIRGWNGLKSSRQLGRKTLEGWNGLESRRQLGRKT
jgi:hypothetical protein